MWATVVEVSFEITYLETPCFEKVVFHGVYISRCINMRKCMNFKVLRVLVYYHDDISEWTEKILTNFITHGWSGISCSLSRSTPEDFSFVICLMLLDWDCQQLALVWHLITLVQSHFSAVALKCALFKVMLQL